MEITRPEQSEYAPYYHTYVGKVAGDNLVAALIEGGRSTSDFLASIPLEKLDYRYANGKWNIREIVIHLTDAERIFTYRALRFSRNDKTGLHGFDENLYVPQSNAANRSIEDILEEYNSVRRATIAFFKSLTHEMTTRSGPANEREVSVRALGYIIAGHEIHHVGVIKERYL